MKVIAFVPSFGIWNNAPGHWLVSAQMTVEKYVAICPARQERDACRRTQMRESVLKREQVEETLRCVRCLLCPLHCPHVATEGVFVDLLAIHKRALTAFVGVTLCPAMTQANAWMAT